SYTGAATDSASAAWVGIAGALALDTTAPTAPTPTVTAGYYTSASVAVSTIGGSDGEAGLDTASGQLLRASAALSNGACRAFGSLSAITTGPGASYTDTTVAGGNCYEYEYTAHDNAGNTTTSSASGVAKVDTSAPSAPTPTLSAATGQTYLSGTTAYYNAQGA